MKTTYQITNKKLFNKKVIDVQTDGLIGMRGTIGIITEDKEEIIVTGEHGKKDYEQEYGFVLNVEVWNAKT